MTTNAADFQRYAAKPNDPIVGNLFSGPMSNLIVHLIGVIVAASSKIILGRVSVHYFSIKKL